MWGVDLVWSGILNIASSVALVFGPWGHWGGYRLRSNVCVAEDIRNSDKECL